MRTKLNIIFSILVLVSVAATAQKSKRLLIIGNSFTANNKMTSTLQTMFTNANDNIDVFEVTGGGMSLENHLNILTGTGSKELAISRSRESVNLDFTVESKWDYVILQEGGAPYLIPEYRKNVIIPTLQNWQKVFAKENTKVLLFEPYATSEKYPNTYFRFLADGSYDEDLCCSDTLRSITQEQEMLTAFVQKITNELNFQVAPLGQSFTMLKSQQSEIPLLTDDKHPTKYGSYLMAAIYYRISTGKEIPTISTDELTADFVKVLNATANQVDASSLKNK